MESMDARGGAYRAGGANDEDEEEASNFRGLETPYSHVPGTGGGIVSTSELRTMPAVGSVMMVSRE